MSETKRPTDEQFDIAVHWLENNEGEGAERDACLVVAAWIDHENRNRRIRTVAREAGVPVAALRRKILATHAKAEGRTP